MMRSKFEKFGPLDVNVNQMLVTILWQLPLVMTLWYEWNQRKIENAAFLVNYPNRALDLPFININGQSLHRNDIQDALQRGLHT